MYMYVQNVAYTRTGTLFCFNGLVSWWLPELRCVLLVLIRKLFSWNLGVEAAVLGSSYVSSFPAMKHMKHILSLSCSNCVADAVTFSKLSEQVRIAERPDIGRELVWIFVGSHYQLLLHLILILILFVAFLCSALQIMEWFISVGLRRCSKCLLTLNSLWISFIPRGYVN
jgi:hypothetical protein